MSETLKNRRSRSAVVGILRRDTNVLVIKRSATVRAPGKICFPGGGIESGETAPMALVRELREELNLDVVPIHEVWQSRTPSGIDLHWWLAEHDPRQPFVCNPAEVEWACWMTCAEMKASPELLESNQAFLEALAEGEFFV